MTSILFVCHTCHEQCQSDWPDVASRAEHDALFPDLAHIPTSELRLLCDDCHADFLAWYNNLSPDDRRRAERAASSQQGTLDRD